MTRAWSPTGLIPWFSKTKGNTNAALLHNPFLFKGKVTQCSRGSRSSVAFLILYVDDILLIGNDTEFLNSIKGYLNKNFQ